MSEDKNPTPSILESKQYHHAEKFVKNVTEKVKDSTGVGKMEGFSLKNVFSEFFKKHSEEEMEEYFGVGMPSTTPSLAEVDCSWPRPWFCWRIFLLGMACFFFFWFIYTEYKNNHFITPGVILFGSFTIPLACLMFFFECNNPKNISLLRVIQLFLYGGCLGFFFTLKWANTVLQTFPFLTWFGDTLAGPIEESAKLAVLIYILKHNGLKGRNFILNGLLCGAAVGAGFAAFESAGYAFCVRLQELGIHDLYGEDTTMFGVLVMRGFLAPFAHIIWTAMCAAALWRVKGDKEFDYNMLFYPSFIIVFAIAVGLHMTWNSTLFVSWHNLKYVLLGCIGWLVIFGQMGIGLRQIKKMQEKALVSNDNETLVSSDDETLVSNDDEVLVSSAPPINT